MENTIENAKDFLQEAFTNELEFPSIMVAYANECMPKAPSDDEIKAQIDDLMDSFRKEMKTKVNFGQSTFWAEANAKIALRFLAKWMRSQFLPQPPKE